MFSNTQKKGYSGGCQEQHRGTNRGTSQFLKTEIHFKSTACIHHSTDACSAKISPREFQNLSKDTLKAPVHFVLWGFSVGVRLETVFALQGLLLLSLMVLKR
jgi:hypothetical protein